MSEKKIGLESAVITMAFIASLISGYVVVNESIPSIIPTYIRENVDDLLSSDLLIPDIREKEEVLDTLQQCRELMYEPAADVCIVKQEVDGTNYWVGILDGSEFDRARKIVLSGEDEDGVWYQETVTVSSDGVIISAVNPNRVTTLKYLVIDNAYDSEPAFLDLTTQRKIKDDNYNTPFMLFEHRRVTPLPIHVDPPTSW